MGGFTQIGNGIFIAVLAVILFFAGYHLLAYGLVLGALTLWLVVELVKALVHRGRPFIRLTQARIVGRRAIGRSFPSGHTSQAFFMATLLAGYFHAGAWAVCLLYTTALLVGITRMYVGAHYPRDVLAGAILGSAWGLLGGIVFGYVVNRIDRSDQGGRTERQQIHQTSYNKSVRGRSKGWPFCYEKSGVCADDRAARFCYNTKYQGR